MVRPIDISGRRFGRLVALERVSNHPKSRRTRWKCRCDCGSLVEVVTFNLTQGDTKSCGCLNTDNLRKHGKSYTPEYSVWRGMKQRCLNPKASYYADYGGRGIKVCEKWANDFGEFYKDVGPRPSSQHSLDRIDVNGNYEPGNVRWATAREQARNTRCDNCAKLKLEIEVLRLQNQNLREFSRKNKEGD